MLSALFTSIMQPEGAKKGLLRIIWASSVSVISAMVKSSNTQKSPIFTGTSSNIFKGISEPFTNLSERVREAMILNEAYET